MSEDCLSLDLFYDPCKTIKVAILDLNDKSMHSFTYLYKIWILFYLFLELGGKWTMIQRFFDFIQRRKVVWNRFNWRKAFDKRFKTAFRSEWRKQDPSFRWRRITLINFEPIRWLKIWTSCCTSWITVILLTSHSAVAQLAERPSKVPVWCNSTTDMTWVGIPALWC